MNYSSDKNDGARVAVVVPYFSGIDHLRRCVDSILDGTFANADVVIVDHSDSDELLAFMDFSEARLVRLKESGSVWWTGATNLGISYALDHNYPTIMLLNHDCFVRPDTIELLMRSCDRRDDCIIAPVQHNLRTGRNIGRATSCFLLGFSTLIPPDWLVALDRKRQLVPTSLIIGGRGVLISSAVFRTVGSFDEELFPHYGADHDFYFRAQANGYRLFINSDAFVDVDDEKTSAAEIRKGHTLNSLYTSLFDRRSHRNLADQYRLFAKYYPLPFLAFVGVSLNVVRYLAVTIVHAMIHAISSAVSRDRKIP